MGRVTGLPLFLVLLDAGTSGLATGVFGGATVGFGVSGCASGGGGGGGGGGRLIFDGTQGFFGIRGGTFWGSQAALKPVASNGALKLSLSSLPSLSGIETVTVSFRTPAREGEQ